MAHDRTAPATIEERKQYTCFTDRDTALLHGLRDLFDRVADELVERFYVHLQAHESVRRLLVDEGTVERLKRSQRAYLMSLTDGSYGEDYARGRFAIGRVHEDIGLDPQWYLGTYGLYLDFLMPHIDRHFRDAPGEAARAAAALAKLLILDMQLILDAYYETRQRKVVAHSEQLAAVGQLAASVAHEVRNPLAGMKGTLQVLRKELAVKPAYQEILDELLAQIDRLEDLVRDLLVFARPAPIDPRPFDLHELLDRCLRNYEKAAEDAGVRVVRDYGSGTDRLVADPQQIEQVCLNLVQNAMQAMDTGGTLTVRARAQGNQITIGFEDTGKGIADDTLTKIFQPFFTTKHRGSGLGLPIVQKIAALHGGTIRVESRLGRATTVTVTLPVREVA